MKRSLLLIGFVLLFMVYLYDRSLSEEEMLQNPIQIIEQSAIGYIINACPDDSNPSFSRIAPSLDPRCILEKTGDSVLVSIRDFSPKALPEIQKGESLLVVGEHQKAREHYMEALSIDSLASKLYVYIGDTYYTEQRYDEAKKSYQKALEKNPVDFQAYRFLADVYEHQGKLEEAKDALVTALIYNMNYDIAWADLRRVGLKLGIQVTRQPFIQRAWMEEENDTTYNVCIDSSVATSAEKLTTWFAFIAEKAVWQVEGKFFEKYPDAEEYYLTLNELYDCFQWLVSAWQEVKGMNPELTDPELDFILRVTDDGFLEEYILLEALSQLDIHLLLELNIRENMFPRFRDFFFRYYMLGT
jgi:tetratricopeptide (TPR) repeat protein